MSKFSAFRKFPKPKIPGKNAQPQSETDDSRFQRPDGFEEGLNISGLEDTADLDRKTSVQEKKSFNKLKPSISFSFGRKRDESKQSNAKESPVPVKDQDTDTPSKASKRQSDNVTRRLAHGVAKKIGVDSPDTKFGGNRFILILQDLIHGEKKKDRATQTETDEFLQSLNLEEAVALLQAELAESQQSFAPQVIETDNANKLPQRFQEVADKVNELTQQRFMTLAVENEVIRIVVFQGREVIAWGIANPDEDPIRGLEVGILDEEYPSRLSGLLAELQFRRLRVVTDLPLYTPLMRNFHIPKIPKRYVDSVIVSEVLDTIPFLQEEVDVPWQTKREGQGDEVYAVAVPRKAVDQHVDRLRELNVQPSAAYSRATALALAAGVPNAIVIHIVPGQAAIIIVKDNAARIVHRLELPKKGYSVNAQADLVSQAVDQVVGYNQTAESRNMMAQMPVILTGQLIADDEGALREALEEVLPYDILPITPSITYPEHFVPEEYAVNIGLALSDWSKTKTHKRIPKQRPPTVNLLSERHLPKPLPVWPATTFVTLLMLGVMALNVTNQVDSAEIEAATLNASLENMQREARRHRLELGQARAIQERIDAAQIFTDDLTGQLDNLDRDINFLLMRAQAMTHDQIPPDVTISTIARQSDGFGLIGDAPTYEDALRYSENLRDSGLFSDVQVTRLSGGGAFFADGRRISFNIKVSINPDYFDVLEEQESLDEAEDTGIENEDT